MFLLRPLLACALLLAAGCSLNKLVADNMAGSLRDAQVAFNREGSPREAREAAPALLKFLDGFIVSSPDNEGLLLRGAEMNAGFAFGFLEEEDPAWARLCYEKAQGYARRALRLEDPSLEKALGGSDDLLKARLSKLEPGDDAIPALFWSAFAWGGYINVSRTDQKAIADLPKVVTIMERLAEIAPHFYHDGPHLFLAVYYSSRGSMLGGDVKKAYAHFMKTMTAPRASFNRPRNLLAEVLYARYYCVALGEKEPATARKLFADTLASVAAVPDVPGSDTRLMDALARERAKKLLPQLDDLILPPDDFIPPLENDAAVKPESTGAKKP